MNKQSTNENFQILYDEIVNSKTELKSFIEASETRVLLKIEALNEKIRTLEKENTELKTRVEVLERRSKENAILVFGLEKKHIPLNTVCEQLGGLLGIEINRPDINSYYWFNNARNNPVKIDFISNLKKKEVLKSCFKLKGTGLRIVQDLTIPQREENKLLQRYLKKARENTTNKSYIRGNRLHINHQSFTLEELQNSSEIPFVKYNSAPSTPTIRNIDKEFEILVKESQTGANNQKTTHNPTPRTSTEGETIQNHDTPKNAKVITKKRKPSDNSLGQHDKPRLRSTKQ